MSIYYIPADNLIEKSHEKEFTCFICFGIVLKPRILNCCEFLICLNCLHNIIIYKNTNCPMCKSPISFSKPNKLIMRLFENLSFKCLSEEEGCKTLLSYKKFFYHYVYECEFKKSCQSNLQFCSLCEEIHYKSDKHLCLNEKLEYNEPK
jgi:hypothetical protein